jgi:hypothetical protein
MHAIKTNRKGYSDEKLAACLDAIKNGKFFET